MVVLETCFKVRKFDNKVERLAKIMDFANRYSYRNESGNRISLIPEKWICIGVYDFITELELADGSKF